MISSLKSKIKKATSPSTVKPARIDDEHHCTSPIRSTEYPTQTLSAAEEGQKKREAREDMTVEGTDQADKASGVAEKMIDWVLPVVKVVKEASAAFPPLQSAAGAVVSVLEVCQVRSKLLESTPMALVSDPPTLL